MIKLINIKESKEKIGIGTISLSVYFALAPLDTFSIIPGISILRILAFFPLIINLIYIISNKRKFSRQNLGVWLYLSFFIYCIIGYYYSVNSYFTINRIITNGLSSILIILCTLVKYNNKEIEFLKKSMVLMVWITIILSITKSSTVGYGRMAFSIGSVVEDSNAICSYFIFGCIYYLDKLYSSKSFNRIYSIIPIILFLYYALLTGSRGGVLSILISITIYIILHLKIDRKIIIRLLIALVTFILCIILIKFFISLMPEELKMRFSYKFFLQDKGGGRFNIWTNALNIIHNSKSSRILFGYGPGTIIELLYGEVAHNTLVEIFIESGLIGLIIILCTFINYLWISIKEKEYVLFSVFIGYLVVGMGISMTSFKPLWNIMILISIYYGANKRNIVK
ncbi:O-antigen ligase family protein [Clostridium perfringens]